MRLKPTKTVIALLGATLVLVAGGTGGVLWLQNSALAGTLKVVEARESEVLDGQKRERRREEALRTLEADRQRLQFLEQSVSDAAYVPTLLKQLEELATRTDNRVLGVQPEAAAPKPVRKVDQRRDPDAQAKSEEADAAGKDEPKEPEEPYTPLVIRVSVIGSYRSVETLIERLTAFPKIVAVEEIQLRPHKPEASKGETATNQLDVDLRVTAFVMKAPAISVPDKKTAMTASSAVGGQIQ
jgi:Tfp pilus assembly protein PilO